MRLDMYECCPGYALQLFCWESALNWVCAVIRRDVSNLCHRKMPPLATATSNLRFLLSNVRDRVTFSGYVQSVQLLLEGYNYLVLVL